MVKVTEAQRYCFSGKVVFRRSPETGKENFLFQAKSITSKVTAPLSTRALAIGG
jgi:hypothetical protein